MMRSLFNHRRPQASRTAFTLVEIVIVIVILGLLSALLLSAFGRVRANAHRTSCLSNLRQLGIAVALYQGDYDGLFPRGAGPNRFGYHALEMARQRHFCGELPPLRSVLQPYVKSPQIWRCPADSGFDFDDVANQPIKARPTSFDAFGTSYYYRTELTLKRKKELAGWNKGRPK